MAGIELADKVYAVIGAEAPSGYTSPMEAFWSSRRELVDDAREDFGLALGVALGIARGEEPFESMDAVTKRAVAAATEAFERYAGSHRLVARLEASEEVA